MINIKDELHNDFMAYAEECNNERAFPDVRDGLKPSQRAIIWTMYDHGFASDKPHVKCAKVDGAVTGELWPHGSEYSAIVRMSQPWLNNISEVDFHGANGSLLGGPDAAASRYTECRLSKQTEDGMLCNIKKNVVDFIPNYSEDREWPKVLPSLMPRLFLNGSQGIGYTIAQEWEPGNLNEFVDKVKEYTKTGKVTCDNIYPDYPSGGIIINKKDIHTIYETGSGKVVLRGKVEVEDDTIKITELPYQCYVEDFIRETTDLINNGQIDSIYDIKNMSDDSGMLIAVECSKGKAEETLNKLYRLTDLQCSFSANQMAIAGDNGRPEMFTLKKYIESYINHNVTCMIREYTYDKEKAEARKEIVTGLLKALADIDAVIAIIKSSKSSDEAKLNLVKSFELTEVQAKAVVDMRLGRLANLEVKELEEEQSELNKTIDFCEEMLSSNNNIKKELVKRLSSFAAKYGSIRKTAVTDVDVVKEKAQVKKEHTEKQFIVVLSDNHLKKVEVTAYKPNKSTDAIVNAVKLSTRDKVVVIADNGFMYKVGLNKLDKCNVNSVGNDIHELLGVKATNILSPNDTGSLMLITSGNKMKRMLVSDVTSIGKSIGTPIMPLQDGETLIIAEKIDEGSSKSILAASNNKTVELPCDSFEVKSRYFKGAVPKQLKKFTNISYTIKLN